MTKIAFIGLGQMGSPMAKNLLGKGYDLTVYDLNQQAVRQLEEEGAHSADSPKQAAEGCEFIITMLPNGKIVEQVTFGDNGLINSMSSESLMIDMSTIHPMESDSIRTRLQQQGIEFMDSPVGRTSDDAITGTLLILAGGTDQQVDRAAPILLSMGNEIVRTGGPGLGIRVKIINNFMSIALNSLSAEAAVLSEAMGLPLNIAINVMKGTAAGKGHFTTTWVNKVLNNDLSPSFMVDLAHKDLGIALDVANQLHVPLSMGAASREIYSQAQAMGRGKQDWSSILELLRYCSGLKK